MLQTKPMELVPWVILKETHGINSMGLVANGAGSSGNTRPSKIVPLSPVPGVVLRDLAVFAVTFLRQQSPSATALQVCLRVYTLSAYRLRRL